MIAIVLLLVACWISAAAGRLVLDRFGLLANWPLERAVNGTALGLVIAAYGVYGLGLAGLLSFWPITLWWAALGLLSVKGMIANFRDLPFRKIRKAENSTTQNPDHNPDQNPDRNPDSMPIEAVVGDDKVIRILTRLCAIVLALFLLIALAACFRPPGPLEWDAISYHLADPKLFLLQHRIVSLPTEHHSNFPFTLEMLFAVGLMYNGYALANLFHWAMAVLTVLALLAYCRRSLHPLIGWAGGVIFVTTPIVLWEASTAYIDIGLALYATLATFAVISALYGDRGHPEVQPKMPGAVLYVEANRRWLLLAGVFTGCALGLKYLALVLFIVLTLFLLLSRVSWRHMALFCGLSLLISSPWYLKNIVTMQNPVYPFLYRVFPQSRYWSADRAASYQSEQDKFGTKPISKNIRSKILNLMSVPWHLLIQRPRGILAGEILYCNEGEYSFTALYGGLYAALLFPLAFLRRKPGFVRAILGIALVQVAAWFFLSQVGRYLIQIMPLMAVLGAYSVFSWAFPVHLQTSPLETEPGSESHSIRESRWHRLPGWAGFVCLFGQAAYLLFSVGTLPLNATQVEKASLFARGELPSSVSVPALLANINTPEAWDADLHRFYGAFGALQWINKNTPPSAGIVLYEDTRGYYLDRLYLWGNQPHSSYIPYETLRDGADLTDWLLSHGIQYALVNLELTSQYQTGVDPEFPPGSLNNADAAIAALQKWYVQEGAMAHQGDRGHQLVGDAIRRGQWRAVYEEHGCVVLQFGDPSELRKGIWH